MGSKQKGPTFIRSTIYLYHLIFPQKGASAPQPCNLFSPPRERPRNLLLLRAGQTWKSSSGRSLEEKFRMKWGFIRGGADYEDKGGIRIRRTKRRRRRRSPGPCCRHLIISTVLFSFDSFCIRFFFFFFYSSANLLGLTTIVVRFLQFSGCSSLCSIQSKEPRTRLANSYSLLQSSCVLKGRHNNILWRTPPTPAHHPPTATAWDTTTKHLARFSIVGRRYAMNEWILVDTHPKGWFFFFWSSSCVQVCRFRNLARRTMREKRLIGGWE